jgi:hypothetical protein
MACGCKNKANQADQAAQAQAQAEARRESIRAVREREQIAKSAAKVNAGK